MGHIYRSLILRDILNEYDVRFITTVIEKVVINFFREREIPLSISKSNNILNNIYKIKPDILINDILDTKTKFIKHVKNNNIKVINLEDLGTGAKYADLLVNEIYEKKVFHSKNSYWGHKFFLIKKDFLKLKRNKFKKNIKNILITFGGTDHSNLSLKILKIIKNYVIKKKLNIYLVLGPGYKYINTVSRYSKDFPNIKIINSTGFMEKIMSICDIAISSNGRTVYELCHMRIPSIIISQNQREQSHLFSKYKNGFINLGYFESKNLFADVLKQFIQLNENNTLRKKLFENQSKFSFKEGRKNYFSLITKLVNS